MTQRTHQQYPDNIVIETQFGPMALTVTDADHICAIGKGPLTVNRVEINGSAHLYRLPNGTFEIGKPSMNWSDRYHSLSAKRRDNYEAASDSARKKLAAEITQAVNAWARSNTAVFSDAKAVDKNNRLLRLEAERQKALEAVAEIEAQIRAVEAE